MATKKKAQSGETVLSLDDLNRATLARQMLLERANVKPLAAIERLLSIQAQWPKPPFIALFSRLAKFERQDLTKLAQKNTVVRGTAWRTTIFVMTAKDYAAFRGTIQPTLDKGLRSITGKTVPEKAHAKIVAKGEAFFKTPHTFDDLRKELAKTEKNAANEAIRHMAYLIRMRVPLLQVSTDDAAWGWHSACDFERADQLIGDEIQTEATAEAHDALVLRYLAALGPATIADAQNFTGVAGLKAAFDRLRPKLVTFRDDRNKELFDLPNAPRPGGKDVKAPVRFLPDFDNFVLGHADRRRAVADEHKPFVYLPGLAVARTYLVDGRVAGAWKVEATKKSATITIEPFVTPAKTDRAAIEEEAERLVRFHEPEASQHDIVFAKPRKK